MTEENGKEKLEMNIAARLQAAGHCDYLSLRFLCDLCDIFVFESSNPK